MTKMNEPLSDESETQQADLLECRAALERERQEHQRTQHALKLLQGQYDELYHLAPVGYFTLTDYDTILDANVTGADMLGMRRKHLVNRKFSEFVEQADHDMFYLHRRDLVKTRKKQICEFRLKKNDDSWFPSVVSFYPLEFDEQGEMTQFRLVIDDVSYHKKTVAALWESEFRYGSMFNNANDMIVIYTHSGQLLDVNPITCERLGYRRDQLWQKTIMDIESDKTVSYLPQRLNQLARQNALLFETTYHCSTGQQIEVEVSSRQIIYQKQAAVLSIARDITKRKETENALRESEQRYKRITGAITDYIYTVRLHNGEVSETIHRPSCVAVTGYTPEEFHANPYLWIQMVYEQDRQAVEQQARDILEAQDTPPLEHRIIRKDGELRWVRNTCVPHIDQNGTLVSYDGLIQDITERKNAEEALKHNEERLRTIVDFTYDWESWYGPDGRYLYVSPSSERICGYSPEEFYENPALLQTLVHIDDRDMFFQHTRDEFHKHEAQYLEFRIITSDGSLRWLGHICQPVYSHDGRWLGRRSSNRDITERKQAEEALKESQAYYRAMLEAFDGLIYVCSRDYRVEFMNEHFIQRTGYNGVGELCYKALHELDEICPWCVNDQVFEGNTVKWEVQSPKDNKWYYVVNTPLYHADGRMSKQAIIQDITDRKQAEEELRNAHEHLEATLNALPDLLFEVDREGRFYHIHTRQPQLLFFPPEECLDKTVQELFPPQTARMISDAIAQALETGTHFGTIYPLKIADELKWFELSIAAKGDPQTPQGRLIALARDITDRKQAEIALRKERDKIHQYLSIAGVMLIALNRDKTVAMINKKGCELLGYSEHEIIGQNWFDLCIPQAKRNKVKAVFTQLMAGEIEPAEYFENSVFTKQGEERIIAWHNTIILDEEGNMNGTLSSGEDITGQKFVEQALRESKDRYQRITNAITDYIYTVQIQHGQPWETIHRAACVAVTGYTVEEFQSRPYLWIDMVHPEDRQAVTTCAAELLEGVKVDPLEHRIIRKDGTTRWVRSTFVPHYDSQGTLRSYDGLIQDITEQKLAEIALQESEERLRLLVESAGDMIEEYDLDGKYIYYSGASHYGVATSELLGKTPFEVFNHDIAAPIVEQIQAVAASGQSQTFEKCVPWEGKPLWFSDHVFPVRDADGHLTAIAKIRLNITDRKRAEELLKQTMTELQRSNTELEHFAYVASHELQQPLLVIATHLEVLSHRYQGKLGNEADTFIKKIFASVERMQETIQDLLEYSHLNSRETEFAPTNCETVIQGVLYNLQPMIEQYQAVVTHTPLPTILANESQFMQLFQNLISNGIKFRREAPPRIHISAECHEDEWTFAVQDNGIGLEQEHADRIFIIFERLHNQKTFPGTGIGLAICKKIVERHGGQIWVKSEPGAGSTFYFTHKAMKDSSPHPHK